MISCIPLSLNAQFLKTVLIVSFCQLIISFATANLRPGQNHVSRFLGDHDGRVHWYYPKRFQA